MAKKLETENGRARDESDETRRERASDDTAGGGGDGE